MHNFPLTKPFVSKNSKVFVLESLDQSHQQGDGNFCIKSVNLIEKITGSKQVNLTPSCTSSLELASMLIDLAPDDEVILPSFNFTSAALAITRVGAVPIFVDVDPNTLCIDTNQIEAAISAKTKAISWVNYAGFTPDLVLLQDLANRHDIFLIEDNAHGFGGKFNENELGMTGDIVTYSFHATKNIQCGEGGAISIVSQELHRRSHFLREKGTNRIDFLEGLCDKYTWVDQGSSFLLSEIQAAVLYGNLLEFEFIQKERFLIYSRYCSNFKELSREFNIWGNFERPEPGFSSHLFYFGVADENTRAALINHLKDYSITAAFHYQALHDSTAGKKYGRVVGPMKQSSRASTTLIRLPLYVGMTLKDVDEITDCVAAFLRDANPIS